MLTILLAAAAVAAPLARPEKAPVPTVVTGAMVLDREGVRQGPFDVWLADGTIAAVLPVGSDAPFAAGRTIDGTGSTLMPGLVDLHVHVSSTTAVPGRIRVPSPRQNLDAMLYAGVTTAFDLGAPLDDVARWDGKIDAGRWAGPEIVGTGRPFGAPGGHPRESVRAMYPSFLVAMTTKTMAWEVADAEGVDAALDAQGPNTFVKLVLEELPPGAPTISDAAIERLRERTSADGTRIMTHVGRVSDVDRAIALPVDALVHSPHSGAMTAEQATALADAHIPVVPTLVVWKATWQIAEGAPEVGPLEREIASDAVLRDLAWASEGKAPIRDEAMATWMHGLVEGEAVRLNNVGLMHAAGVEILVGSDSPGLGLVTGAALHRELALLVDAGLSPAEVLAAATFGAHRFLDPDAHNGAVEPSYEADLLLVRGDPTEDLAALTDVAALWVDGRLVDRTLRRAVGGPR